MEEIKKLNVGNRLVVHGFSSIRTLSADEQRRLGKLCVVAMNAYSYIPHEVGTAGLERSARLLEHKDSEKGYPVEFSEDGQPIYDPSKDANVFFGPLLDQVRDFKVKMIADGVYKILENLGYARLAQ